MLLKMWGISHENTCVGVSFDTVTKTPTQLLFCGIFKNFKNTYFEEHLRITAPERFRSPFVV